MATFLEDEKLDTLTDSVAANVSYAKNIIDSVVKSYTGELDRIMCLIKTDIVDKQDPAPVEVIEKYFLELSNCLYFIGENAEKLGIYDSISKSVAKETFNNYYMDDIIATDEKGKKRTVAELTALAENASVYEQTVSDIYNRAYKTVKVKVSSAENMCNALSKIISRRMGELQLSAAQPATFDTRKVLNENLSTPLNYNPEYYACAEDRSR